MPEGGFGQRVPFGDFSAKPQKDFQKPKFDPKTNVTTFPGGYVGPIHNNLRSVPVGTPAMYLGHPEETGAKVNEVLFDSNMWRHVYDYATLRAGTTVHATVASGYVPAEMPEPSKNLQNPERRQNEPRRTGRQSRMHCWTGPRATFIGATTRSQRTIMATVWSTPASWMSNRCRGHVIPDKMYRIRDTTALYRRRHFLRLKPSELLAMDNSNGIVYSVDGHGRAREEAPGRVSVPTPGGSAAAAASAAAALVGGGCRSSPCCSSRGRAAVRRGARAKQPSLSPELA